MSQTNDLLSPYIFRSATHAYTDMGILGGGQTATVHRVRQETTGQEFALKLLKSGEYHTRFFREVETLRLLERYGEDLKNPDGRPLVPKIEEYKDTGDDQFIVMTLAFGKPLDEIQRERGRLPEKAALGIVSKTAQLFHILHTQLHRSYLDFQPRNIYWEEESDALLILDWNLLSPLNQADVQGDVEALGALLYRLLVGVQPPAYGLSSVPEWDEVTPATQAILRKATHANPTQQYSSAQELGDACVAQLHLWREPTGDTVSRIVTLEEQISTGLASLKKEEERPSTDLLTFVLDARNQVAILEKRETELDGQRKGIYENIKNALKPFFESYGTILNQGISFLALPYREAAGERFRKAILETSDPQEKLTASRWLLVSEIVEEPARTAALQACQALAAGNPDKALDLLTERVVEEGKESVQVLRGELQAIRFWKEAQDWQESATRIADPQRLQKALDKLQEIQTTLDRLASMRPEHAALLVQHWGDLAGRIADMKRRITEIEERASNIRERREMIAGRKPAEIFDFFEKQFKLFPRNPELVSLALESAENQITNLLADMKTEGFQERIYPTQQLLSLALAEGFDSPQHKKAIRAEWAIADALKHLADLLNARYVDEPGIRKCFEDVANPASQALHTNLVTWMTRMVMAQAHKDDSLEKAVVAVRLAQKYAPSLVTELTNQQRKMHQEYEAQAAARREQDADYWINLKEEIRVLRQRRSWPASSEALTLLSHAEKLIRDSDRGRQSWVEQTRQELSAELRTLELEKMRQEEAQAIQQKFDQWQNRLHAAATANEATNTRYELSLLAQEASSRKLDELASEIRRVEQIANAVASALKEEESLIAQAQEQYRQYTVHLDDPDFRTARLAKLRSSHSLLSPLAAQESRFKSQGFIDLWQKVETAWRSEGGKDDPSNLDNPLQAKLDETSNRVEKTLLARLDETSSRVEKALLTKLDETSSRVEKIVPISPRQPPAGQPKWLTWVPIVTLAVLILASGIFAVKNWNAPSAQSAVGTAVAPVASAITKLQTSIDSLAAGGQSDADTNIVGRLDAIQASIDTYATSVSQQGPLAGSDGQGGTEPNATEQAIQERVSAMETQEAVLVQAAIAISEEHASLTTAALKVTMEWTGIQTTATAQRATATALKQNQDEANAQLTQARGTATALVANAAATATFIAQSVAPTATPTPSSTPTPTSIAWDGRFTISFPPDGAELYVAPWQVEVTAQEWFTETDQYRLLLNDVELKRDTIDSSTDPKRILYERGFDGNALMDSFPGLTGDAENTLNLDTNKQLRPNTYTLNFQSQIEGDWKNLTTSTFTILGDGYVTATENIEESMLRRLGPSPTAAIDRDTPLLESQVSEVRLLGQTLGNYQQSNGTSVYEPLVLWEATTGTPRRGWAPARFFDIQDGKTIEDMPVIAPDQPE